MVQSVDVWHPIPEMPPSPARTDEERIRALLTPAVIESSSLANAVQRAIQDVPFERGMFVMMRYQGTEHFQEIEQTIVAALRDFGLEARLARGKAYSDDLWENVRVYLHTCKHGIAVFEEIEERSFNPNIAIELGYMYALGRRVLLLKEKRLPRLPTDVVGRIYRDFDGYHIRESIGRQLRSWLEQDLGLVRKSRA